MKNHRPSKRYRARAFAMQILYQHCFIEPGETVCVSDFTSLHLAGQKNVDRAYFNLLAVGSMAHHDQIDAMLRPFLDRELSELNPVEYAILQLALYELQYQKEVPPFVVLNEAIELAKQYGSVDGYKYVNGVLNAVIKARN